MQQLPLRLLSKSKEAAGTDFEIYSAQKPAGRVCLGGNGCDHETQLADQMTGTCSNYIVFVGPDDLEPFFPGQASASARYFDGDSDCKTAMLSRVVARCLSR